MSDSEISRQETAASVYPLSPLQQGMLYHTLKRAGVGMYVNQAVQKLESPVLDAYRHAWNALLQRHTILRTSFHWEEQDEPFQRVHRECEIPFRVEDWRHFGPEERDEKLARFLRFDRRAGFDLRKAPLIRVTLLRFAEDLYYNVITHHHIIMDGWSGNLVMPELRTIYEASKIGRAAHLPDAVSYSRFLEWLQTCDQQKVETFWRAQLRGLKSPTPLPLAKAGYDTVRAKEQMGALDCRLPPTLSVDLMDLARSSKVTLSSIIHAAWGILLWRHSGVSDVVFGLLVSGRPASLPEVESMVGMFLNTVPYRVQVDPDAIFSDWLQELRALQVDLSDYEFASLATIRSCSELPRSAPIFECIVSRKDTGGGGRRQSAGRVRKATMTHDVPLLLEVASGEEMEMTWSYDPARFEQGAIVRIAEQLQSLLQSIVSNPRARLQDIGMLSPAEREMVVGGDARPLVFPDNVCLHEIFEQQVERTPENIAVVDGKCESSYRALNSAANRLAHYLMKHGVRRGHRIGLCLPRSTETAVGLLAILKCGAAYVPLDPSYPADRLRFMGNDAGLEVILTTGRLANELFAGSSKLPKMVDLRSSNSWEGESQENPRVEVTPSDLAYILYTSGSTGRPKGVAAPHRVPVARIFAEQPVFEAGESCCAKTSLNFIDSIWELFLPWKHGARTTLIPEASVKDPETLVEAVAHSGATRIVMVPSLLRALLESEIPLSDLLPHMKYWISSGEALPADLCTLFASRLPDAVLVNIYGTTETWDATRSDSLQKRDQSKLTIGKPLPGASVYVLDEAMEPCAIGVSGELYVGGSYLPIGYWGQPEMTAEKFCPNPFAGHEGERLYRTGDLARYLPDGNLEYLGRRDNQVKVRGFRVEPNEIEAALRQLPAVRQAVVVLRDSQLAAFLTLKSGFDLHPEDARIHLQRTLPSHMVPAHFVKLEALPLTPNGKVDRLALPALDEGMMGEQSGKIVRAPAGETEEKIAAIWSEVLRVRNIDAEAQFFEVGGDSLSAIRVVARLSKAFQRPIALRSLIESPTVASMARWIDSGAQEEAPELEHEDSEEAPLTFTQRRLWFLDQLNPGTASYTIPNVLHLHGPLEREAISASFRALIERHSVLRTVFRSRDGEPFQLALPVPEQVPIRFVDLSHLPPQERKAASRRAAAEQGRIPWDLANGPLYRVQVLSLSREEQVLSTAFHHIIADGRSMGIFSREFALYYQSYAKGVSLNIPELPIQYADFARWERRMVQGDLFQKQLAFWKERLRGAALLEMPVDNPRPAVHQFRGKKIVFDIPEPVANRMRSIARAENATSFMWILAGFQMLLSRYCNQTDVMIGTAMWNRSRVELEKLIGLFVNTIPMRHDFSGDPTPREALRRVRDGCLGAFSNMDLPFEEMLKQVQVDRDLSRQGSPLFQIMLIHQPGPGANARKTGDGARGVSMDTQRIDTGFSNFDLLLSTNDTPDAEVSCMLSYDLTLFEETSIRRFVSHLQILFAQFAKHPDRPFSQISFLDKDEHELLVQEWGRGEACAYSALPVHKLVAQHAERNPGRPAVKFGTAQLTYHQLDQQSSRVAHFLLGQGTGREEPVAICVERGLELIVAMLAVMKAGATVVTIDPSYPRDRIDYILRDCGASRILVSESTRALFAEAPDSYLCHLLDLNSQFFDGFSAEAPAIAVSPRQLAYVIYTSGSTGKPKGVMVEHRQLSQTIQAQIEQFEIGPDSRVLQMLSLSFDAAMGEVFRTLVAGGLLLMARKEELLPGPDLAQRLAKERVTVTAMSPTALGALPDVSGELTELETLIVGGESCPADLAARWMKGRRLLNGYGPTETTIGATVAINWEASGKPPLGRPLPNVELYVLDPAMEPTPVGVPGELFIGGAGVARGYLKRPSLTAERFVPNPFSDTLGSRLYRTGDLVRWRADGQLDFIGRIDQQVKIRGHRIELGEIEAALTSSPDVQGAVVVDFDHGGTKKLAAYVLPSGSVKGVDVSALREHLRGMLPDYMMPATFMPLSKFPMTSNGKIDRRALPAPMLGNGGAQAEFVAPRTDLERQIAVIWQEVLGVDRVGVNDNFFEMGGDSISSIRVIAAAGKQELVISPQEMFKFQTVSELAHAMQGRQRQAG